MKIGIISEFSRDHVNYGNTLQAYALNSYIKRLHPDFSVETIVVADSACRLRRTSYIAPAFKKVFTLISRSDAPLEANSDLIVDRLEAFRTFQDSNINMANKIGTWNDLLQMDHDVLIVGSDVVWAQFHYAVSRVKFLDFETAKPFKRISYSASFGTDWIPAENKSEIRRCLSQFDYISVRESSSVELLKSIGIPEAKHALDPTLLLAPALWSEVEEELEDTEEFIRLKNHPFVFVYLLEHNAEQRIAITEWCTSNNITMITVPFANEKFCTEDERFGDIRVKNCSPGQWLWLVRHASYVFTDSFHGIAFCSNFGTKFIALSRNHLNNRISNYLLTIKQEDKLICPSQIKNVCKLTWHWDDISNRLNCAKHISDDFLEEALS